MNPRRAQVFYRAATFYDTIHFCEHNGEMVKVDIPTDFHFNTYAAGAYTRPLLSST